MPLVVEKENNKTIVGVGDINIKRSRKAHFETSKMVSPSININT